MRVLVVDNDVAVLEVVCALLHDCGVEAQGAADPQAACGLLAAGGWDALLSDFLFPGAITGLAVAAEAMAQGMLCVIMSGAAEVEAAVTAQGVRFLAKPFSMADLMTALGISEVVSLAA
jgi:DNA-binding NtrC family response regulator